MSLRAEWSMLSLLMCGLVATGKSAPAADPLIMPRELVDYAAATGCAPIDRRICEDVPRRSSGPTFLEACPSKNDLALCSTSFTR